VGASLSLRAAQTPPDGASDRDAIGLHHLWPYVPGHYAGFFHDPGGIKLEIVYVP
jgi:hypothetical protein